MIVCTGCGSSLSTKELKAIRPRVRSCCPERDMQPLTKEVYEMLRTSHSKIQSLYAEIEKEQRGGWELGVEWYKDEFKRLTSHIKD